ncbi:MAG: hypothetical protein AAF251_08475 [Pseudomonadota bacterium]
MVLTTSKSIDGVSDLVVVAPIKRGMIDAFENLTYESRLSVVAEALHKIRVNAREHEVVVPFADTVERILTLFNFRIGIIDEATLGQNFSDALFASQAPDTSAQRGDLVPQRYMFLAATFGGPIEPYLRLIWNPLGPFLDLLLCNCEGYKFATEVGFPEYLAWVRDHQVEPAIFYSTSGNTLRDQFYLAQLEKRQRDGDRATGGPASDEDLAALTMVEPEAKARETWDLSDPARVSEALRLSLEALNVLYRLADYFPPDKTEGAILLRASRDLLRGLEDYVDMLAKVPQFEAKLILLGLFPQKNLGPFTEQWLWFKSGARPPAQPAPPPVIDHSQVQKGLLSRYDDDELAIRNAAVMMFAIRDKRLAANAIKALLKPSYEDEAIASEGPFWFHKTAQNLAFTAPGLMKMGLEKAELEQFPREFVEGLFERAPMLGDVRDNHPRRWEFPPRRDLLLGAEENDRPPIHSEEVDLVFQLRIGEDRKGQKFDADRAPEFIDFEAETRGLETQLREEQLLDEFKDTIGSTAAETLGSAPSFDEAANYGDNATRSDAPSPEALESALAAAFAFADASRDEEDGRFTAILRSFDPIAARVFILTVLYPWTGLRLLAVESTYRNLDSAPPPSGTSHTNRDHFGFIDGISQPDPKAEQGHPDHAEFGDVLLGLPNSQGDEAADLPQSIGGIPLTYGSFMVFRKIAQFPERLEALKARYGSEVAAMIVGRREDGESLIPVSGSDPNDFDFECDTEQELCPFSSHIRLSNPRDTFQGRPAPKILRRGMSYGKRYDPADQTSKEYDRGLLFIAYNASLAEQYEVIQRWLNRGNATHVASAANDPLTGVQLTDDGYTFRYRRSGSGDVARVHIKDALTQVRWGLYGFVPSRAGLAAICEKALGQKAPTDAVAAESEEERAFERIKILLNQTPAVQRDEWKRLIEDAAVKDPAKGNELPPVWRAIRNRMGGVLRLDSGIAFSGDDLPEAEAETEASQPAVLVAQWDHIESVLSDAETFSSKEQGRRTNASFGSIYVAMDPDKGDATQNKRSRYAKEAIDTNQIVMDLGRDFEEEIFDKAYAVAKKRLEKVRRFSGEIQKGSGQPPFYKIEFRRDFLAPVLGGLCQWLFDLPDASFEAPDKGYIEQGGWGVQKVDTSGGQSVPPGMRKPRCPGDFMAPSRRSFYPRPTASIIQYGNRHGKALRQSSLNWVMHCVKNGIPFKGRLSGPMAQTLLASQPSTQPEQDLLARNIIGLMEGMLPPTDGIMRGILFDWIEDNAIWQHQSSYIDAVSHGGSGFAEVEEALRSPVYKAIRKRPAPDLIYRTAIKDTQIAGVDVKEGDLVVLALGSAMQEESGPGKNAGIYPVFGGKRKTAFQTGGEPTHACPAKPIVMAMVYGMIAALFDAGRIVVQPASLIVRISDWNADAAESSARTSEA